MTKQKPQKKIQTKEIQELLELHEAKIRETVNAHLQADERRRKKLWGM